MNRFRTLRADEIDCRVSQVKDGKGVTLLLYKDARCDQNILDETVGSMNWQRHHTRDNANCIVSIWDEDKKQWIEKEDTGTESRTEREKGLASDSFKRACFNWGIGRELYTAPFIYIKADACNIDNGKCYDNFTVDTIEYQPDGQREIRHLIIRNEKTGRICYQWQIGERKAAPDNEPEQIKISTSPATITAATPEQHSEKERMRLLKEYAMMVYGGNVYKDKLNTIYQEMKVTEVTEEVYKIIRDRIANDIKRKGAA